MGVRRWPAQAGDGTGRSSQLGRPGPGVTRRPQAHNHQPSAPPPPPCTAPAPGAPQVNANYAFIAVFTLEMVLKLLGLGFWDYIQVGADK